MNNTETSSRAQISDISVLCLPFIDLTARGGLRGLSDAQVPMTATVVFLHFVMQKRADVRGNQAECFGFQRGNRRLVVILDGTGAVMLGRTLQNCPLLARGLGRSKKHFTA